MNGSLKITIPRADWTGTLDEFVNENNPFMKDYEMERLVKCLKEDGIVIHTAGPAGDFVIVATNRDKLEENKRLSA